MKYGDLESLIQDLNASIRRLNTYLKSPKNEIDASTSIQNLNQLVDDLKESELQLLVNAISFGCGDISTVAQAIEQCANNEQCARIGRAWRDCLDNCLDVKDTVDAMKTSINNLSTNIVNDETKVMSLAQIRDGAISSLSVGKMKTIYEDTIKESFCPMKSFWSWFIMAMVLVFIVIMFSLCTCKQNDNKNNDGIGLCISDRISDKKNDKGIEVLIDCNKVEVNLDEVFDSVFNRINTVCFVNKDDAKKNVEIQLLLLSDSCVILDSVCSLNSKFCYLNSDTTTTINRIMIMPLNKCEVVTYCNEKDKSSCSHDLFKIIVLTLSLVAMLLLFLFMRPLIERNIDNKNKMNEKILQEKLRVQSDWQEILQAKYRLDIRREEQDLNLREKREKAIIDNETRALEHERHLKVLELEQEHEYRKSLLEQNNRSQQNDEQRLKDLNEQILKLLNSLTSN